MKRGKTGVVLFAHGSRVAEANDGVRALADKVRESGDFAFVEAAFLELATPDLARVVAGALRADIERVIVVPYFLTSGTHLRRDLPELIERERVSHPGVKLELADPLEGHPLLLALILDRIRAVPERAGVAP